MSGGGAARARLAAVGYLAGLVGHKARNRLALVRAGLELLAIGAEDALTPEHRAELLAQLDRFLGDYNLGLEMIRCDFGARETGLLRAAVEEAVAVYRPHGDAAGLSVACEHGERPEGGDEVALDRRLLRLILLNLLRNAEEAGARHVTVRTRFGPRHLTVEARDDGPGVDPAVRPKLFREAVSTRAGGTGLGLLVCADAAAAMGGRMRLAPGASGAAFILRLPL